MSGSTRGAEVLATSSLLAFLSPSLAGVARQAARLGGMQGRPVYAVGGVVRDWVLGRPCLDLDLLVEMPPGGEGPADDPLLRALVRELDAALVVHPRFGTATLALPGGLHIDVVRARTERYPEPAALPVVAPSHFEDDLRRRDFALNALAWRLDGEGQLLDPFGGLEDLRQGRLRVLHDRSFIDDPTRLLRGVRYAARLGFELEPHTRALAREALAAGLPERLSAHRVGAELWRLLREVQAPAALALLGELGGLPSLRLDGLGPATARSFARIHHLLDDGRAPLRQVLASELALRALTLALLAGLPAERRAPALERWDVLGRNAEELLRELVGVEEGASRLRQGELRPSALLEVVGELSPGGWLYLVSELPERATWLRAVQHRARMRPPLSGRDLLAMGLPPGPRLGALLAGLRAEVIDGRIEGEETARAWIRAQQEGHP